MSVLENNVKAKIVETTSMEANITIKTILNMVCKHWEKCLDNYYIMESEPELSYDSYGDSVTVNLSSSDRANIDHIMDDVATLLEDDIKEYIKEKNTTEPTDKKVREEGWNGEL